ILGEERPGLGRLLLGVLDVFLGHQYADFLLLLLGELIGIPSLLAGSPQDGLYVLEAPLGRESLENVVAAGHGRRGALIQSAGKSHAGLAGQDGRLAAEQRRAGAGDVDAVAIAVDVERRTCIGRSVPYREFQLDRKS